MTAAAQVNCAPQYGLENWRLRLNDGRSTSELRAAVRTGKLAVTTVIREMGYSNIWERRVLKMFTVERKAAR